MNTKEYVQSLFRNYEETGSLKDFMEELQSNMDARIASLVKKGVPEQEAFDKAKAELGDVSALADELSLKKRKEVFEDAYMDIQKYMTPGRIAAYVIFGVVFFFGIIASAITHFAAGSYANLELTISGVSSSLLPFFVSAVGGFTWLGVTQETGSHFPVSKKRAVWYTVAAGMISLGIMLMPTALFAWQSITAHSVAKSLGGCLIIFVLPGIGLLVYLILSEKNRLKPWAIAVQEETVKQGMEMWGDPQGAARFGMYSGAIWIFAIAFFLLLGFLIGFRFSWLVFIFATAIQLLVQALMMKKKS